MLLIDLNGFIDPASPGRVEIATRKSIQVGSCIVDIGNEPLRWLCYPAGFMSRIRPLLSVRTSIQLVTVWLAGARREIRQHSWYGLFLSRIRPFLSAFAFRTGTAKNLNFSDSK